MYKYYTQSGAYPTVFLSGFIFDINKVELQDGTQHEKQIWKITWINLRTRV